MIDRFFFHPRKNNSYYSDLWKQSEIALDVNQNHLQGWLIKAPLFEKSPFIIYYGGNAEDISINLSYIDAKQNHSLLLMNYRGFGGSTGYPSQKGLFSDALTIYDHVVNIFKIDPDKIFLLGRSIGASIAAFVASQRRCGGLILITPFDSIANLVPRFLNFSPLKNYLDGYFNTQQYLEKVDKKILVIAALEDEVLPRSCLENLLKKFPKKISLVEIKQANHQNIADFEEYAQAIEEYIH